MLPDLSVTGDSHSDIAGLSRMLLLMLSFRLSGSADGHSASVGRLVSMLVLPRVQLQLLPE